MTFSKIGVEISRKLISPSSCSVKVPVASILVSRVCIVKFVKLLRQEQKAIICVKILAKNPTRTTQH